MFLSNLFDLSGRVALVTGGARGLGFAMAEALGGAGARVFISDLPTAELDRAVTALRSKGINAAAIAGDLTQLDEIDNVANSVMSAAGQVDILVNNAGIAWVGLAEAHPHDAWESVLKLNLTGTFALTQRIGTLSMIPRRSGSIINMASLAGLRGSRPDILPALAYHATKGGLVNFTRALAGEWGPYGIRVNSICPSFVVTDLTREMLASMRDKVLDLTPLRRIAEPEDLHGIAVLLASDAARHITGQNIAVDGGVGAI